MGRDRYTRGKWRSREGTIRGWQRATIASYVVTAIVAAWAFGAKQTAYNFVGAGAFLDVALFLAVAFGIHKGSRIAADGGAASVYRRESVSV